MHSGLFCFLMLLDVFFRGNICQRCGSGATNIMTDDAFLVSLEHYVSSHANPFLALKASGEGFRYLPSKLTFDASTSKENKIGTLLLFFLHRSSSGSNNLNLTHSFSFYYESLQKKQQKCKSRLKIK